MAKIHSHYETLQVARNASLKFIKGAYQYLSQKYHPDLNPGDDEAARIMSALNAAFDVLSDPIRRQHYDAWIAQEERQIEDYSQSKNTGHSGNTAFTGDDRQSTSPQTPYSLSTALGRTLRKPRKVPAGWWWATAFVILIAWTSSQMESRPRTSPAPYTANPTPQSKSLQQYAPMPAYLLSQDNAPLPKHKPLPYVRSATAPNGYPWPTVASDMDGYPQIYNAGLASVVIDNTQGASDLFAKLVSRQGTWGTPMRTFFIPAHAIFVASELGGGNYDLRFRNLNTGVLSRSDAFNLKQVGVPGNIRHSEYAPEPYKLHIATMHTNALAETWF